MGHVHLHHNRLDPCALATYVLAPHELRLLWFWNSLAKGIGQII